MRNTDMYKHTKSTKEGIMIEITWLHVIGFSLLSVLVHTRPVGRVPGISFLVLHCLGLELTRDQWNFQFLMTLHSLILHYMKPLHRIILPLTAR